MGTLQGPVTNYTYVKAKQVGGYPVLFTGPLMKANVIRNELWGFKGSFRNGIKVECFSRRNCVGNSRRIRCSSSSSWDSGSMAENFNENDDEYVNSSIVEAGMKHCS